MARKNRSNVKCRTATKPTGEPVPPVLADIFDNVARDAASQFCVAYNAGCSAETLVAMASAAAAGLERDGIEVDVEKALVDIHSYF